VSLAVEQKCTVSANSCDNYKTFTFRNNIILLFDQVSGRFSCDKSHYHKHGHPNCILLKVNPHKCFRFRVHFCSIATHAPSFNPKSENRKSAWSLVISFFTHKGRGMYKKTMTNDQWPMTNQFFLLLKVVLRCC